MNLRHLAPRSILAPVLLALLSTAAVAQSAQTSPTALRRQAKMLNLTTYRLWDGNAPGQQGNTASDIPTITLMAPSPHDGNGTAVIIAPGGAYVWEASNLEGRQVADWFAAHGVTAFVLHYRLGRKYLYPIPLLDAQRAIRLVRFKARELGYSPNRIGFVGFSAGGHLAASTATMFDNGNPSAADPIDRLSSRPDFVVLGYPWLNAMDLGQTKVITYCSMLKLSASECGKYAKYNPTALVTSKTPPTFIYSTTNDDTVPVMASVRYYEKLVAAGVPAEMHLFLRGGHGSGLGKGDPLLDVWPRLLEHWMRVQGLLTPPAAASAQHK